MDEAPEKDSLSGWGSVVSLLSKASERAEELGRDDIFNMIVDSFDEMEKVDDPQEMFFSVFQFAYRMYYRLKGNDIEIPLNRVRTEDRYMKATPVTMYAIDNYDYQTFMWARKRGFTKELSNLTIIFPADSLTPAERARFDKKIQNQ